MTQPLLFNPKSTPMSPFFDSAGIQSDVLSLSDSSTGSFEDGPFLNFNDSPPDTPTSVQPSLVSSLPSTSSPTVSSQTNQGSTEGVSLDMLIPWLVLDEEGKRRSFQISCAYHLFFTTPDFLTFIYKFYKNFNSIPKDQRQRIKDIVCHLVICTPKQQFTTSLLKEILEFCERLFPGRDERDNINQVKLCIIRKHGSSRIVYFRKRFNQVAPKHPLRFLEYSSEEIAQQLTLIEFSAFKFIENSEFHSCAWQKENKHTIAPNIVYLTEKFNTLTFWVATQILNCANNLEQVTSLIKRLLRAIQLLVKYGNMNTALSLYAGLTMHPVLRLKHVWSALPLKYKDSVDQIDELGSPHQNYCNYRRMFNSALAEKRSFIPFLPVHLRDLFATHENNVTFIDEEKKLISRPKLLLTGEQIDQVLGFQISTGFDFTVNPQFYADYTIINPITTDELDTLSYSIVPPPGTDTNDLGEIDTKRALLNWRSKEVVAWIANLKDEVSIYSQQFSEVDGQSLMGMTSALLQKLGVDTLGHRKKLLKLIRDLDIQSTVESATPRSDTTTPQTPSLASIDFLRQDAAIWNSLSVQQWLKLNNIDYQERECLIGIDGSRLLEINSSSLTQLGLKLGTAKKIIKQVNNLKSNLLCGLPIANKNPAEWTVHEVSIFLQIKSLGTLTDTFLRENINGQVLLCLTKEEIGNLVPTVGQKLILNRAIRELSSSQQKTPVSSVRRVSVPMPAVPASSPGSSPLASPSTPGTPASSRSPSSSSSPDDNILIEFVYGTEKKILQFQRSITLMNIRRKLKEEFQLQNFSLLSASLDGEGSIKNEETLHRILQSHCGPSLLVFTIRPSSLSDLPLKKKRSQTQHITSASKV